MIKYPIIYLPGRYWSVHMAGRGQSPWPVMLCIEPAPMRTRHG